MHQTHQNHLTVINKSHPGNSRANSSSLQRNYHSKLFKGFNYPYTVHMYSH